MEIKEIIKGLKIEKECVSRDCNRDCANCDIVQDADWLLDVYQSAIDILSQIKERRILGYCEKHHRPWDIRFANGECIFECSKCRIEEISK